MNTIQLSVKASDQLFLEWAEKDPRNKYIFGPFAWQRYLQWIEKTYSCNVINSEFRRKAIYSVHFENSKHFTYFLLKYT